MVGNLLQRKTASIAKYNLSLRRKDFKKFYFDDGVVHFKSHILSVVFRNLINVVNG